MKTSREVTAVTVTVKDASKTAITKIYDASVDEVTKVLGAGVAAEVGEAPEWKERVKRK